MPHQPAAIDAELPPYAISLAERGRSGALAIYAGAGISFSEPTGLPAGDKLAMQVHARLVGPFPILKEVAATNLVAIADAVQELEGGEDALRQAIVKLAEFTTADPSYGHRVLALLLLEGAIDVLTTNWDDCIERGSRDERVHAVINQHDLANTVGPSVLKIHGCASQPSSLLISTAHLDHPPQWVDEQTRARLGAAVVVFVGIGDVAGYVKERLTEAVTEVGTLENVRVVSPSIVSKWDTSQWKLATPALADEHKIATTADMFLEQLARAYVYLAFADMRQAMDANSAQSAAMKSATDGLGRHDPVTVLSWIRRSGVVAAPGDSVLRKESAAIAFLALGFLGGDNIAIDRNGVLETPAGPVETLISVGVQSVSRLRREAQNRLEQRLGAGQMAPRYLVSGGVGWSTGTGNLPDDIYPFGAADDILDGPASARAEIIRAEEVVNR